MDQDNVFITLEGIDGSGKSSQIPVIKQMLESNGLECVLNKEPGGTEIGAKIREVFLFSKGVNENLTEDANIMLVVSSMSQSLNYKIKPALEEGKCVISDRFIDSTLAYQGSTSPQIAEKINLLKNTFLKDVTPTLTLLFDLPVELAHSRIQKRDRENGNTIKDNLESKGLEYFNKVRNQYLEIAKNNPTFKIIDASKPKIEVEKQVRKIVNNYLIERKKILEFKNQDLLKKVKNIKK